MDLLGKQGKQALERLEQVEQKIKEMDSHLSAVDNALQDFVDNYSRVFEEELDYHEAELNEIRKALRNSSSQEEEVEKLENRINTLEARLNNHEEKIESIIGSDLEKTFSELVDGVRNVKAMIRNTQSEMKEVKQDFDETEERLETRIEDLESEIMVEINNRDFDFDKKLDKREFEDREQKLEEEVKKLRASVVYLADQMGEREQIEVE